MASTMFPSYWWIRWQWPTGNFAAGSWSAMWYGDEFEGSNRGRPDNYTTHEARVYRWIGTRWELYSTSELHAANRGSYWGGYG